MSGHEELRNMILSFRVSELSDLLGFAGRNKTGKKQELQSRALDLLKLRSAPVQMKIHELHKRRFNSGGMMSSSIPEQLGPNKVAMGSSGDCGSQALAVRGPMHPTNNMGYRPDMSYTSQSKPLSLMSTLPAPNPTYPIHPDVQLKPLPFYDILAVLVKPSSLIPSGTSAFQENSFEFHLSPQQTVDILTSKHYIGMTTEFVNQIQLRFCLLETSCEQEDNFPPSILVKVNGKLCQLPNPIPTNRPGVEPKRPSRPVNITSISKLCATSGNIVSVSWASEYSRPYVIAIYMVKKLDSRTLMSRLRTKGMRNPDHTRAMIKEKLSTSPDSEIATTSLRGSLICPIGKRKMTEPCRPVTCTHLQCFDADLFIKMNEKKPRWICPVCDKPAPFKNLAIDGLFSEISAKAPSSCYEVQFHEDGSWTPIINESDKKDMLSIDSSNRHVTNHVRKKQKKNPEIVDLTCNSDSDDEWSSSSSVPPQSSYRPLNELDQELIAPSTSSMVYPKPPVSANAPFVSLESSPMHSFGGVSTSSRPPAIVGSSEAISTPAFIPISGQTTSTLQQPMSSSTSRAKDSSEMESRYGIKDTSADAFSSFQYMNSSPYHYYSPDCTPPHDGSGPSGYNQNENPSFDLYTLLSRPEMERNSGEKIIPDVISLD